MDLELEKALQELRGGWVEFETQAADFGDERLSRRFGKVLEQMSASPQAAFTQSSEDLAELLAAYRFVDNQKVTTEKILLPHRERAAARASNVDTVFLVQDTTYLDYSDHFHTCDDLQPLRIRKLQKALWLHATLALLPNGLPLGLVDAQFMTGNKAGRGADHRRNIEDKLSYRWLEAVNNCVDAFPKDIRKVWICDREADIFELYEHIVGCGEDFVIRSRFLREIEEKPFFDMRDVLRNAPVQGCISLNISAVEKQKARVAQVEVRFCSVTVAVPYSRRNNVLARSIPLHIVEVKEINAPEGVEPLYWRVVSSLKVESFSDALSIIDIYKKRWAIEELFKVLKSGCRVEKAQFHTTKRLEKYIALSLIVAWRIYYLVHLNRLDPNAPVETILTSHERDTLQLLVDDKRKKQGCKRRFIIRTVGQGIQQIARLGGYLDRKNDPYPGVTVLWKGTTVLAYATMATLAYERTGIVSVNG